MQTVPWARVKAFSRSLGGQVGVQVFQLLGGDKGWLTGQADGFQLRELPAQLVRSGANGIHNIAHGFLQKGQGAVLRGDDLLPVPLVYINAVQVVKLFVAADGVHVGHKALAGAEPILSKGIALPFGQAVHNFSALIQAGYIKADGALHAVQIIVQAAAVQSNFFLAVGYDICISDCTSFIFPLFLKKAVRNSS